MMVALVKMMILIDMVIMMVMVMVMTYIVQDLCSDRPISVDVKLKKCLTHLVNLSIISFLQQMSRIGLICNR